MKSKTTKKTGVYEWANHSYNFQRGCTNSCRYCYARYNAVDRFHRCTAEQWTVPLIDYDKVIKKQKKLSGGIMFPSTHDITPANIDCYIAVLLEMLDAGNQVLIVTKPHFECIEKICDKCVNYKDQIKFRFTIGSMNDEVLSFWEPNAPKFNERLRCLEYAFEHNYKTSVSCEPFLDGDIDILVKCLYHLTNDTIWIGKMRNIKSRVDMTAITDTEKLVYIHPLERLYSDEYILGLVAKLKKWPFIKWKDSIKEVIARNVK